MKYKLTETQYNRLIEQIDDSENKQNKAIEDSEFYNEKAGYISDKDDMDNYRNEEDIDDFGKEVDPQPEYNEEDPWIDYDNKDKKRYTVMMDFYLYGKNDEDIIKRAKMIEHHLDQKYDNQVKVVSIHETPFASGAFRELKF